MKKLIAVIALVMSVATLGRATDLTIQNNGVDTGVGPGQETLNFTGSNVTTSGNTVNVTGITGATGATGPQGPVGATGNVGTLNGETGSASNFQTLNVNGASGSNVTVSQSGTVATLNLSGLQTIQGNTNASNINTLNSTVGGLSTVSNSNSTAITNVQNMSDNSLLTQTVNTHTSQIGGIQNMTDNSVLTNTVNNHTTQIGTLNNEVAQNTTQINKNTQNINSLQNQVDEQNKTKLGLDFEVRLLDSKRWSLYAYDIWQANTDQGADVLGDGHNFMFGTKVVFKLGKSYEEERLDSQKKEMDQLRAELYRLQHAHASSK